AAHFRDINVPMLTIAAWYDILQGGSLRNYISVKQHGASDEARKGQRLVVMIGGHAGGGREDGHVDLGEDAVREEDDITRDRDDGLLKGQTNDFTQSKPVRIFVMGQNQWREEDDWPLARAKATRYFLHSSGKANSLSGDGALSTTAPRTETADHYV